MAKYESTRSGISSRVQALTNRVVSADTRKQVYSNISTFAHEQPLLAAFVFLQIFFSFTPLLLFTSFVLSTIILSLSCALLFSLFWVGAALLVLVPTLFVTTGLGIAIWVWGVGSFVLAKWLYSLVPVSVKGHTEVEMPNGKTLQLKKTGEGYGDIKAEVKDSELV